MTPSRPVIEPSNAKTLAAHRSDAPQSSTSNTNQMWSPRHAADHMAPIGQSALSFSGPLPSSVFFYPAAACARRSLTSASKTETRSPACSAFRRHCSRLLVTAAI